MTPTRHTPEQKQPSTSEAIRAAAFQLFGEHGFGGTSVRAIAKVAGIDPALVIRHFGSKEALFLETTPVADYFEGQFDGPLDTLGERIAAFVLGKADARMLSVYTALMRASDSPRIRERLRDMTGVFATNLAARLDGEDAYTRALLVSAQVSGLLSVLSDESIPQSADRDELAKLYGRAMQTLIDQY
ncbi:TetR family transcriptional regulator [Rhodococcus sp. GOMB7]|uniref:TetR/AcrR family transcriptional regulator n=1 Tax=Rhodococcus TaxID=1827 RepID=UPI0004A8DCDC|nr:MULTISPECIES: TetR family transcriptional regulator [Rhodococcus]KDQ01146.1 TetR family transcriptional regulator [Rhodococcus qingshengii]MBT9295015.1 TetR family transcriptional regulator [Rhodococcus sp. GOMB7]MDJ0489630.1 TetR family transcriptional regulator [Rhodococcus qingshengii]MDV8012429.1 TetR family transcriptional regulator [Rhodococcus sp. IEGM 1241]